MAVIQGMSTRARDGATREKLLRVATSAMSAGHSRRWLFTPERLSLLEQIAELFGASHQSDIAEHHRRVPL